MGVRGALVHLLSLGLLSARVAYAAPPTAPADGASAAPAQAAAPTTLPTPPAAPSAAVAPAQQAAMVQVQACPGLEAAEVERVLTVELASAAVDAGTVASLRVEVQCGGEWIRLTLQQRGAGEYLDRLIPGPPAHERGRERIVALAASQMVLAWLSERAAQPARDAQAKAALERAPAASSPAREPGSSAASTGPDAPVVAGSEPKASEAGGRPTREAEAREGAADHPSDRAAPVSEHISPSVSASASAWPTPTIWLRGVVRSAGIASVPTTLAGGGLVITTELAPRLELDLGVEAARGNADRRAGVVGVTVASAHGGLAHVLSRTQAMAWVVGGHIAAGYLRLAGQPASAFVGESREGATLEVGLRVGPRFRIDPIMIGLMARAGAMFGGAEGMVAGGRDVRPAGVWLGAALQIGLSPWPVPAGAGAARP